ncbi:MAG: hypothetical protein SFT92_02165 [Rickettsiales bacterium]|nr:hypothetical protein [Rickettsiales bacterium]
MYPLNKKTSFADARSLRPDQIFLVRGRDHKSKSAWYYVAVDTDKRDIFKSRQGTTVLDIADYGNVLHSGYGVEPPQAVKELMQLEYGFKESA